MDGNSDRNDPSWVKSDDQRTSLEENLEYGVPNDSKADFERIEFDTALNEYKTYMHAVHGMIYVLHAKPRVLWGRYEQPAEILMQARADGNFGFPGGLLDKNYEESVVDGLNREIAEEINMDMKVAKFSQTDHMITHVNHRKKMVNHFYAMAVNIEQFREIEKRSVEAEDWGYETYGIIRVPLIAMDDGYRGLPVFLANQFVGNAKAQLLHAIRKLKLLPEDTLKKYIQAHEQYVSVVQKT